MQGKIEKLSTIYWTKAPQNNHWFTCLEKYQRLNKTNLFVTYLVICKINFCFIIHNISGSLSYQREANLYQILKVNSLSYLREAILYNTIVILLCSIHSVLFSQNKKDTHNYHVTVHIFILVLSLWLNVQSNLKQKQV